MNGHYDNLSSVTCDLLTCQCGVFKCYVQIVLSLPYSPCNKLVCLSCQLCFFFFQAEDGIRDWSVTGVQTCALPISIVTGSWRVGASWAPVTIATDGSRIPSKAYLLDNPGKGVGVADMGSLVAYDV